MAYRPRTFTSAATARQAVNWDEKRTSVVVTNISGETGYKGVDASVTASGDNQGSPIFNNGRYSASFLEGRDPRNAIWIIGVAGGNYIIDEEFAPDPLLEAINRLTAAIQGLRLK